MEMTVHLPDGIRTTFDFRDSAVVFALSLPFRFFPIFRGWSRAVNNASTSCIVMFKGLTAMDCGVVSS